MLVNEPFMLNTWMVAEVDQQPKLPTSNLEVVDHLGPMLVAQLPDCLDLDDDALEAEEVRLVELIETLALVSECETWLLDKGDFPGAELDCQTRLVDGLEKSTALLFVDLQTRPDDAVALFLENNMFLHFSRLSRLS